MLAESSSSMIIGLTGLARSGKDTVGAYLVKERQFERLAFADPLKKSVAALLDIPFNRVDQLKLNPDCTIILQNKTVNIGAESAAANHVTESKEISFRELLQRYGTEAHREVFGYDFWVDQTLPVQGYYPGRAIVVTDVRFDNEAARVKKLGGAVWAIERDGIVPGDAHASEILDFPVDLVIQNNGTFEELFANVEDALTQMTQGIRA